MSSGCPHAEKGLKSEPIPRDHGILETGLKSEPCPGGFEGLTPQASYKLNACVMSEQITGAPLAGTGTGPALAAVDLACGGGAGVWADSIAPMVGLGVRLQWSRCLTSSADLCCGFGSTVTDGHPG